MPPPAANRAQNGMNSQPRFPTPRNDNDDNNVTCGCNKPAILLTVRKQNANHGKQFYKCQAGRENGGCDFFLWAPESSESSAQNPYDTPPTSSWDSNEPSSNNTTRGWGSAGHSRNNTGNNFGEDDDVLCNCGEPCKKITVHKEGPNKGRPFYGCAKDISSRCNFFQWADAGASTTQTDWGSSSSTRGGSSRGRGRGRAGAGAARGATGGQRLCSICRQPGHTRIRCPNAE